MPIVIDRIEPARTAVVVNAAVNMGQTFGQLGLSRHNVFDGFVDAGIATLLTKLSPQEVATRLYERADRLVTMEDKSGTTADV